ncbi:MAG: C39 family peptidase [Vulcanimicrobiota bacterium]
MQVNSPRFSLGSVTPAARRTLIGLALYAASSASPVIADEYVPRPAPPPEVRLLPVPDTRQSTVYSCGAAALQAVLMYYGQEFIESDLMTRLGTDPENGTPPHAIVKVARELGLNAELREGMTLEDLAREVRAGVPVIIDAQAWSDEPHPDWKNDWVDGHYMVVVGIDEQNVYFEDPSTLGSKGVIPRQEFLDRWHDVEADGRKYWQSGIVIKAPAPAPPPDFIFVD